MADDARETPPRLAVSDSRLLWERGVVLPPFEAAQTWAVDLAVDLAHGRVQLMPPVSVSNGRAVQLYQQLLCDVKTRPASCRGLAFGQFLGRCRPCTSASRLLGRRNCCRACRGSTRFDETKIISSRGCFRSSARLCRSAQEARKSRSMCKHGPRSKLFKTCDFEPMRHLKTDGGGGDLVSVMLNGSGGLFFSAATRTPAR